MDNQASKCPVCQAIHHDKNPPQAPPCETCRVELDKDNEEVAMVYMMTRNQVITADMGQVIDINIQAVKTVMDLYEVSNQKDCLARVIKLFHHFRQKNES